MDEPQPTIGCHVRPCVGFLICAILAGCNPGTQTTRADLTLYLQRVNDWAPVEAETARTIERIIATQFVDEAEVRRQVTADAARVAAHLARIETIQPTASELRDIHRRYVETWRRLDEGYRTLLRGLDTGQVPDIAAGRAALEAWRRSILEIANDLRRLQADIGA